MKIKIDKNIVFLGALAYSGFVVFNKDQKIHFDDWHQESVVEKVCDTNNWVVTGSFNAITKNPAHTHSV